MIVRWPNGYGEENRGKVLRNPVKIRDVLPTLLDAAGVSAPRPLDGTSLLNLAPNPKAEWREWIDLEHDVCYAASNHRNATADGRRKYIFHAMTGGEQFFDLESDPYEQRDLARDAGKSAEVAVWRERLAGYLAVRAPAWVLYGKLQARPKSQLHSPNYPGK